MAESFHSFTDEQISNAEQKLYEKIANDVSASQYFDVLENNYRDIPQGRSSLLRMQRAARFIQQHNTDSYEQSAYALYRGELLASHLLDYLVDEEALGGDLAHAYIQHRLKQSTPTGETPETPLALLSRHLTVANTIRHELATNHPALEDIAPYDHIAERYLKHLLPSDRLRYIARSGFRLIVLEAIQPSHLGEIAPAFATVASVPEYQEKIELPPSPDLKPTTGIPEELLALNDEFGALTFEESFEDRSRYKKILVQQFTQSFINFKELGMLGGTTETAIYRYCENKLNALVNSERLFTPKELLSLNGDYFARVEPNQNDDDEPTFIRYGAKHEIRGTYAGITVIDAPSNKELLRRLSKPADFDENAEIQSLPSPAIRIINPVVITYHEDGERTSEINTFTSMEIPLVYKNYTVERAL